MSLTKEALINPARKVSKVTLSDGTVNVRVLSAAEAMDVEKEVSGADDIKRSTAVQIAAFLCDSKGDPLITVEDALQLITRRSPGDVQAILKAGWDKNQISGEALEDASGN